MPPLSESDVLLPVRACQGLILITGPGVTREARLAGGRSSIPFKETMSKVNKTDLVGQRRS